MSSLRPPWKMTRTNTNIQNAQNTKTHQTFKKHFWCLVVFLNNVFIISWIILPMNVRLGTDSDFNWGCISYYKPHAFSTFFWRRKRKTCAFTLSYLCFGCFTCLVQNNICHTMVRFVCNVMFLYILTKVYNLSYNLYVYVNKY